ncbi:MAG: chromosome segregation protein SMC [Phycisphaerae bacterium]|jgi:chromosome segregation protein
MKLKKLIVSGFKSFADRVEFEFDDGISCIVGPNGCGKSNVVDAIKWVLGEQSAKSLRGSEMMDVIFNGSSARRPAGHAEVTLVFDNSSGLLQVGDPPGSLQEVAFTRRLFRSGQSDYLMNKAPCRLRDVREAFMDTGVGIDAYSVIEQGRVESFLQASQDDRRAIFDEAAGISKYKARKKEALRKLERVEQNLLRINDVFAEVEKRLRSIKYQAGKARSYQGYSEKLKELRGLHFLAQYHTLSLQRTACQKKLDAASDSLSTVSAMIDQLESARSGAEVEAVDLERTGRELQARIAAVGSQILSGQQRVEMLEGRVRELGEQIASSAGRCEAMEAKIEKSQQELQSRQQELATVQARCSQVAADCDQLRGEHSAGELAIAALQGQLEDEKAGTIDLLRRTAQLHNEIHASQIRQENLHGQQARLSGRTAEIVAALEKALAERAERSERARDVQEVLDASRARLEETRAASGRLIDSDHQLQNELAAAREKRSGIQSRMGALREMLSRLEGVGQGTRRVLEAKRAGQCQAIRGMLSEFISTDSQHAPVVEAALAGADQQLVAARFAEVEAAREELAKCLDKSAAVEVLCLDRLPALRSDFDVAQCPGIIARIVDWVQFDSDLAPAMWRLLGSTFVVASLADAAVAAESSPAGSRFVTLAGEVLEADGRVRLGSANRSSGTIVRRSELSELAASSEELTRRIDELSQQHQAARGEIDHLEQLSHQLRTAIYETNTERVENESRLAQVKEQIERLEREKPLLAADLKRLSDDISAAVAAEHQAKTKAGEIEQLNLQRQAEVDRLTAEIETARQRQAQLNARMTELKVALAGAQAQANSMREACAALARGAEQMSKDLSAARAEIMLNTQRRADAESGIASAKAEVERLYAQQEQLNADSAEVEETRTSLAVRIEEIRKELSAKRKEHEQAVTSLNAHKLEASETDVRIENLIARATDEMNMKVQELYGSYQHDEGRDWQAVSDEIQELRDKIERLGNVNLDAIAEQDELEKRREFLSTQLADIEGSKTQLTDLIRRINKESRQMFIDTFETIRTNFQELFRKLFGGGKADILLMDPENVLECGIEVVARPPGKETRSLMLLSGGEKTMTALALLFSIFKSRPSPFCLLDEVDAALDEANTDRFTRLVQEFISTSQFLIISHSKRTIAMANVLYGVTMQEPGVSRRISVRFEDAHKLHNEQLEPAGA